MITTATLLEHALSLHRANRYDEALAVYDKVLEFQPDNADARHLKGLIRRRSGAEADGLALIRSALISDPSHRVGYDSHARALADAGRPLEAAASFRRHAALNGRTLDSDYEIGRCLFNAGRYREATEIFEDMIARAPTHPLGYRALASVLMKTSVRLPDALAAIEAMITHGTDDAAARVLRANALNELGRYQESLEDARQALAQQPDNHDAHHLVGLDWLALGAYRDGFHMFERRINRVALERQLRTTCPYWDGQPGDVLKLHHEGGFGDLIQFLRFVPAVAERFRRIDLYVPAAIADLIDHSRRTLWPTPHERIAINPPGDQITREPLALMMSLAHKLGIGLDDLPGPLIPYLNCPPDHDRVWRNRLGHLPRPRVGICWNNEDGRRPADPRRDLPVASFLALREVVPATLVSVKSGDYRERREPFIQDGTALDVSPHITTFSDSAGLLTHLDLLITIDTAIAHLAGALGRPVWLLVNHRADWRWLTHRPDSPWYPSMTVFRAERHDDWDSVFARVRQALARWWAEAAP